MGDDVDSIEVQMRMTLCFVAEKCIYDALFCGRILYVSFDHMFGPSLGSKEVMLDTAEDLVRVGLVPQER